jgi:hypothetical protein
MQMRPREGCPKHMVMGPCGGVREGGGCEVIPGPCVFPTSANWPDPVPAVPLRLTPLILADYTADPYSVPMLTTVAGRLRRGSGRRAPEPAGLPADAAGCAAAGGRGPAVADAGLPGPEPDRA